jgi:hypothetical protein
LSGIQLIETPVLPRQIRSLSEYKHVEQKFVPELKVFFKIGPMAFLHAPNNLQQQRLIPVVCMADLV